MNIIKLLAGAILAVIVYLVFIKSDDSDLIKCIGNQTLVNGVCNDPKCIGEQTVVNGICTEPKCIGNQTLVNGVCNDPKCIGEQTVVNGVCTDPTCQTGQPFDNVNKICVMRDGTNKVACIDGYYEYNNRCRKSPPASTIPGALASFYTGCNTVYSDVDKRNTQCGDGPYRYGTDPWEYKGTSLPNNFDFVFPCVENRSIYQTKADAQADCPGPLKMYQCPWPGDRSFQSIDEAETKCPTTKKQITFRNKN